MRNRLWIIIILLIAWMGQWVIGITEMSPEPMMAGWATRLSVTGLVRGEGVSASTRLGGMIGKEGWLSVEDLAGLIVYQVRGRLPWLTCCCCARTRSCSHCRRQGRGGTPSQRGPTLGVEGKEDKAQPQGTAESRTDSILGPQGWGLRPEMSLELPERLTSFWQRYIECFKTKTRNSSEYAYHYLSGLLRLETKRNYTNIGEATGVAGENIQHFMSNSPWSGRVTIEQVQEEIKATPGLEQGSVLLLDESADEKAGDKSAGAGRQHNGRLGKVEMSQVGVFLAYVNLTQANRLLWSWVDGELFLQEHWFRPEMAQERKRVGLPPERKFETKIELGWKMIRRTQAKGLPFEAVAFDDLYGRSTWLRDKMTEAGLTYMADVPRTTQVYLEQPLLGVPEAKPGRRGRKPTRLRVLNGVKPLPAYQVARHPDTTWKRIRVRPTERGELNDPFAVRQVWTLREEDPEPVQEWLVIRREAKNRYNYALSNASADTSIEDLAWLKCQRYFVERANQDAKSEAGWAELEARKYRGWQHHLALVILATWFVAQTKWDWVHNYLPAPALLQHFALEVLPALSMANIRLLLRAAMPLPQPTPEQAVAQVTKHLVNRTRSRKSRLKRQQALHLANAPP